MNRFAPSSLVLSTVALSGALVGVLAGVSGCLPAAAPEQPEKVAPVTESPALPQGTYQVQSIGYDDASGAYQVFLLDPPAGHAPLYTTTSLRMARLTDEDLAAQKKSHLVVDAEGPAAKLAPDFQIAVTHNVTEQRGSETVIVRQETGMWSPFMSAMTGAMIGNMLFAPRYYYPPPYVGGGPLVGYGGVGDTRQLAAGDYSSKHGAPPKATVLSKTGYSKMPSSSLKPTGSGAGASRFKSTKPVSPMKRSPFGGGGFRRRR